MTRYVIIGMGAAGMAAAGSIRLADPIGEITCISGEKDGAYSRPGLAYYLNKEVTEKSLYEFSDRDFREMGINVQYRIADRIDTGNQEINFTDGKRLEYDRMCLAVGAKAVKSTMEGLDLDGVVYLDSMNQTRQMIKLTRWKKRAIVVGGGITALEMVEGLAARGVRVDYLIRGDRYWNRVLDETESRIIESRLRHDGIRIHLNTEIERVIGQNGKVQGVMTQDGRILKAGILGIAVGVRPRLSLAQASGIDTNRGIRVNPYMETSVRNVFAAGDAAEVYDPESGESVVDSLWPVAKHQGAVAGMNMAGKRTSYQRLSPLNVTRLTGLTTTIIGRVGVGEQEDDLTIVRGESETWQIQPDAVVCQMNFDVNRVRVMVGEQRLLGAVVMGDQALSRPLEELIAGEADISRYRDQLVQSEGDLGRKIHQIWQEWRQSYAA